MVGVGDFDGDGRSDLFWRNDSTGANTIWRSGNNATQTAVAGVANQAWQVVGIGDFDGDGRADLVWAQQRRWDQHDLALGQQRARRSPSRAWPT
jgi:hypothetical protein